MTFIVMNMVFWCIPLHVLGLLRLAMSTGWIHARTGTLMDRIIDGWVVCNHALIRTLRLTKIHTQFDNPDRLSRTGWYLVVSNHQTWPDIIVLQDIFRGRIPPLKFFTKRELLWIPFAGTAMWFLGFPYVHRYSREALAANPELRERDKTATLRACDGFKERPTSVLNFLEGTRFTPAKHEAQQSQYRHLLVPKSGGLGYVGEALGERVVDVIDVTIDYDGGAPRFWDFFSGRCPGVDVTIHSHGIPDLISQLANGGGRDELKTWVDALWHAKDERLTEKRSQQSLG